MSQRNRSYSPGLSNPHLASTLRVLVITQCAPGAHLRYPTYPEFLWDPWILCPLLPRVKPHTSAIVAQRAISAFSSALSPQFSPTHRPLAGRFERGEILADLIYA
eukprot:scaffold75035_cov56-Phaeocystis_antarctica.AAC.5